ncbi:MAG: AMP-binding protein [Elusimicrobia bacterium]|nr:AMP-binding protein [Elusimicrobiota bacterium]
MTLGQLLKESAAKNSQKKALFFADKSTPYQELYQTILKVAANFSALGIQEGDKVGLLLKNSPEFIFTAFALTCLGATAVPINFFLKNEEIAYILSHVGACGLVTQSAFLPEILKAKKQCAELKTIWVTDLAASTQNCSDIVPFSELLKEVSKEIKIISDPEKTALILYTSGTTGKSKGVMLSHKNLISNALGSIQALGLTKKERFICLLPMFHVFAWTTNVLIPLYLGCPIVIVEAIRPPKPWLKLLAKEKITIFAAVPQIFALLAEQAKGIKKWILKYLFFRTVKFCISGAAPLSKEVQEKFETKFGIPLLEGYGLSETSPVVSANSLDQRKPGSVGRPIPDVKVKIINENEKELKIGEEGEICIQGPNIMQGYYKEEQATKEAFTKDGWFKTGDRIKDMIIVKGLKVFSIQVEEVLLSHPAVAEAAVVGIPNPEGDETVKAFVVLKENQTLDKAELIKLCQEKLPPYKRPRDIEIRKELPKNALQKILKKELKKIK